MNESGPPQPDMRTLRQLPGLSDDGAALGEQAAGAQDFYQRLKQAELLADAVLVLPHRMTKQQAVWWGCLVVWKYLREGPPPPLQEALRSCLAWLKQPEEATRRRAEAVGRKVGMGKPAGCVAMAAAWSGGSLAPPDLPPVPPAEHLTAQLVGGSVVLAVAQNEPQKLAQAYRQVLVIGEEVLEGRNVWTPRKA